MAKSSKSVTTSKIKKKSAGNLVGIDKSSKFVVPMPGKGTWHKTPSDISKRQFCKISCLNDDLTLEDIQVRFLMEREYPID